MEGQDLHRFLQQIVVGITGLPGAMVRPRWQPEPPNQPLAGVDWAAIGVKDRSQDTFAYNSIQYVDANTITLTVYRTQTLNIMCKFYGPNSEANAELLSMGFQLGQNREVMALSGFSFVEATEPVNVPEQVNEQWLYGVEVGFSLRRQQLYTYSVLTLLGAVATVVLDNGETLAIDVSQA
jgi:hypothetical protein